MTLNDFREYEVSGQQCKTFVLFIAYCLHYRF
jgi:hypothetical protein